MPYDYDAMSYTFSDMATLETDYGRKPENLGLQDKIALFGNPGLPGGSSAASFAQNIIRVSVGGFGPGYDQVKTLRVHKKLELLLVSAFSQIKRLNRAGHLCFAMNPAHCFGFNHRMIRGYEDKTTLGYLSNHSWGTAIDINSRDNRIGDTTWTMPPEVVQIFYDHGFMWGGYFGRKDAMHFEYRLERIIAPPKRLYYAYPMDLGEGHEADRDNLDAYLTHTEHKHKGGFFPLGANSVWHGGLHLHKGAGAKVVAMADGELVGLRLASDEDKAVADYGSRNFILLRHRLRGPAMRRLKQDPASEEEKRFKVVDGGASNVRTTTSSSGNEPIGQLRGGDVVRVLEGPISANGYNWYKIEVEASNQKRTDGSALTGAQGYVAKTRSLTQQSGAGGVEDCTGSKYWYSLYMHLNHEDISPQKASLRALTWLPRAESHGYEIRKALNFRSSPTTQEDNKLGTLAKGDKVERLSDQLSTADGYDWAEVKVVSGTLAGTTGHIAVSGSVAGHVKATVSRSAEPDEEALERITSGDVISLSGIRVQAGQQLWTGGEYGSDSYWGDYRVGMIHWEVFSEENLMDGAHGWQSVEDTDGDYNVDNAEIVAMVDQEEGLLADNDMLSAQEINDFYAENPDAPKLRHYACRFISEWGIDLDKAVPKLKKKWWPDDDLKERIEPYLWWDEAEAADIELPADRRVWHYNPAAFVAALWPYDDSDDDAVDIDGGEEIAFLTVACGCAHAHTTTKLAGYEVELDLVGSDGTQLTATVEGDGRANFPDIPAGTWKMRLRSQGGREWTRTQWQVEVGADGQYEFSVALYDAVADALADSLGISRRTAWGSRQPAYPEMEEDCRYDTIVIHHSGDGGATTPGEIEQKHMQDNGWDDVGYHFLVAPSGSIYEGRRLGYKGSHTGGANTAKLGIIVLGDFHHQWWDIDDDPTTAQITATKQLVKALAQQIPELTTLGGHRDYGASSGDTACPGDELYKSLDDLRTEAGLNAP